MKKFLLTALAVLGLASMASAETYTFNMAEYFGSENKTLTSWTMGGFTFTANKNNGANDPAFNGRNGDVRLYSHNTLNIAANGAKITQISFEISKQGLLRFPEITVNPGAIEEQGANPLIWLGDAQNVTFSVGSTSDYGTEEGRAGQFDFTAFTITTDGPVADAEDPQPTGAIYQKATAMAEGQYLINYESEIAYPLEASYSYGYLKTIKVNVANNQIATEKANAFLFTAVDGGYTIQDPSGRYYSQEANYNTLAVSAEPTESSVWAVELQDDGSFIIKNVATEKTIQYDTNYGSFGCYPDVRGVYPCLYKYLKDGDVETPQTISVIALDQLASIADKEPISIDLDLTVVYAYDSYVYVYDGKSYGLVYKKDLGLEAGQVVAKGWTAKMSIYNGLFEIVPDAASLATNGTAEIPAPTVVTADNAADLLVAENQNTYVTLKSVTFEDPTAPADAANTADRTFYGSMGDFSVTFFQRFGIESVSEGTYDVTGFIAVYKTTPQIYPVQFNDAAGIEGIMIDNAAPVYYNLQGVEIANPQPGRAYIKVANGRASKIIK